MEKKQAYSYLARYYDTLMNIDYLSWVDYLQATWERFDLEPGKVLDLACGTGNITIPLAKKGYQVTALDISNPMLTIARNKAVKDNLQIEFIEGDMRNFSLSESFDVVLCCCDSINYLTSAEDLIRVLNQAYKHTRPGGLLLFDLNSELKLREVYGNQSYAELYKDFGYFWDNYFDDETEICRMELTFFVPSAKGLYKRVKEVHFEKLWRPEAAFNFLTMTNWNIEGYYGFLSWNEPGSDDERWQFVASKIK